MREEFGSKIRCLRKDKRLTLRELSQRSGIEVTYLSKIENNKTGCPEEKTIMALAGALRVDEDTKQELFRLAKQLPQAFKDELTNRKIVFEVFRSTKNLSDDELSEILEEIKKRKKNAKNNKK